MNRTSALIVAFAIASPLICIAVQAGPFNFKTSQPTGVDSVHPAQFNRSEPPGLPQKPQAPKLQQDPSFKPGGNLFDKPKPSLPSFDQKPIKVNPGQPTGDLPSASRSMYRGKPQADPNAPFQQGGNTGQASGGTAGRAADSDQNAAGGQKAAAKEAANDSGISQAARTSKTKATKTSASGGDCSQCRGKCANRRNDCGNDRSCKKKYAACIRGCSSDCES
jgi:hypothetical protein